MGDRVSIQFTDSRGDLSAVLSDHWGGMDTVAAAYQYAEELARWAGDQHMYPLHRLEPDVAMLDFIRSLMPDMVESGRVLSGFRIVVDENHCDNSDNGHWVIPLRRISDPEFGQRPEELRERVS